MSFLYPEYAWTFLLSLFAILLYANYQKKVVSLFQVWNIEARAFRKQQFLAFSLALILFPFLLMKPVIKSNKPIYAHSLKGHTILFALDVSNSMREKDFLPNRIDWSLQTIANLSDSLYGNQIGLILYSDFAHTIIPITADLKLFKNLIQQIHSDNIKGYSSNLRACFSEAVKNFYPLKNKGGKVLVLFSDGEHYGDEFTTRLKNLENQNVHLIWIPFQPPIRITPLDTITYKHKTIIHPQRDLKKFSKLFLQKLSIIPMPTSLEKYAYELDLSPFLAILIFFILLLAFFLKTQKVTPNEE